jgi:phosphoribosylamine--glycine ligase
MGDPETEAVMPRLQSDLLDLFDGVAHGTLDAKACIISPATAVTVVCVSGGYPEACRKGFPVEGWQTVRESLVFHAGTAAAGNAVVTAGGRVLAVTSLAENIPAARQKAYEALAKIHFENMYFRRDIGMDISAPTPNENIKSF